MSSKAATLLAAAAFSLTGVQSATAGRFAVGVAPGADRSELAQRLRTRGATRIVDLAPIRAFVVSASGAEPLRGLRGTRYVEALPSRTATYVPNDPFFSRQWYAIQDRSFDAWLEPPPLASVRVAVIDSGVDGTHPELQGRIAAAKSFVAGPPTVDTQGHGTFVAGLIAARTNDGVGIAGLAPAAELLIAKVVGPERSIPVEAEAKAIRWAVANDARIINMSLGGLRDPDQLGRDTYSRLEADSVSYAVSRGVLVIAAVGNSDQSPSQPWPYASWPAALPHVLGVSALNRKGGSPVFSNRDPQFNDIAAPGTEMLSTFPLPLTAADPACLEQGYSSCGPEEYRTAEGTSFATPQVTAAAAMLLATVPTLRPDQVARLLEQGALDAVPENGCGACTPGHDRFTGAGRLDLTASLGLLTTGGVPPADRFEPNDEAGTRAYPLFGSRRVVDATIDYWNDRDDVYRIYLRTGERLVSTGSTSGSVRPTISLWRPGTDALDTSSVPSRRLALRQAGSSLVFRARAAGWYVLDVRLTRPGHGAYHLVVTKTH